MHNNFAPEIKNIGSIDTPALLVYPDMVKHNISHLINLCGDAKRIRPHIKTHKCPEIIKLLMEAGINKFKCATISEAEMLASIGAADILLAYQPVGPKVNRLINLILTYPKSIVSCLIDNAATAVQICNSALEAKVNVRCFIDLNVGMNRTGILPGADAKALMHEVNSLPGITIMGLHAYDGHIVDPDINIRIKQAEEGFKSVLSFRDEMAGEGFRSLQLLAGSTPTLHYYIYQMEVECCSGTFIYWDQHYKNSYPELPFEFAALVVTRVISKPSMDTVCLDLGYKAISSENEISERVEFLNLSPTKFLSHSEEHLLVKTQSQHNIAEEIYGVPYHIGRTCNLYESVAVVAHQRVEGFWKNVARARRLTI